MVSVSVKGTDRLLAAISRFPEMARKNLRVALKEGLLVIEDYSSKHHRYKSRTGRADSAYKITSAKGGMTATLALDPTKKAPYINILHEGSKPHPIKARNKKTLRFISGGKFKFPKKVNHPGTRPDPFLYEAQKAKHGEVMAIITNAIKDTIKKAGF